MTMTKLINLCFGLSVILTYFNQDVLVESRSISKRQANLTPISSCPTGNNATIIVNNLGYNLCSLSQYNVPSQSWPIVANDTACALLCSQTQGCTTAVFDRTNLNCHIKGNPDQNSYNWVYDNRFDAIRLAYTPQQLSNVNGACPFGQYGYTDPSGNVYTICPLTDYETTSYQILQGIADVTSCASLCNAQSQCTNAVYDNIYHSCHLKGQLTSSNSNWKVDTQFNTIQLVTPAPVTPTSTSSAAQPTQTLNANQTALIQSACPNGGGSIYTTQNGLVTILCPNTDFAGQANLANVAASTIQACAETCSTTPGCYNVVYEPGTCHMKGSPYTPNQQQSNYYSTITVANTTANNQLLAPLNGLWSNVIPLDVIAVGAYIVPAYPSPKQFFAFASWSPDTFAGSDDLLQTAFASYDFTTNQQGEFTVTSTNHNMFCPGMNSLADGRLLIDGGDTDDAVSLYNPFTNSWSKAANMQIGRGYQSSVLLSNGKAFTIGGSWSGGVGGENGVPMKNGEIYDPVANTWTLLNNALVQPMLTSYDNGGSWRLDNHGWLYAWTGGSVFQAGPSKNMNWYGTSGQGSQTAAGVRNPDSDQMCGVNVMYDAGKIWSAAGSQSYTNDNALAVAHRITLNGVNNQVTVDQLPSLNWNRAFANAVVLPNGKIFVTGGQQYAAVFTDTQSVLQSEIYDPYGGSSTVMAPASVPRNYHSTALLLPDGRIMSGGGGLCYVGGDCDAGNHQDIQFYTPSYFFDSKGNKITNIPTVSSIKASSQSGSNVMVKPGGTLTVALNNASGLSHVLIRMGSATHSVDTDQRRIPLTVTKTSKNTVTLAIPNDNGIVPPGFWYYFAVASNGAHSVGKTVNVLAVA